MLKINVEKRLGAIIDHDDVLTHNEIDKLVSVPKFIKDDASISHSINYFIKRPGGYYILLFILIFNFKKIPCTIEMLNHYIPHSVCSKATLSNIIKEALQRGIIIKEDCRKDKRIKKIIPSQLMIDEWDKMKNAVLVDLGVK